MLTNDQEKALEAMKSGKNVFLSGDAGTGKSFVLETFIKNHDGSPRPGVVVTAPTGIAALHVGGQTLHSLFHISPATDTISAVRNNDIPTYGSDDKTYKVMKAAKTLVIDEISMVRADLFSYIVKILNSLNPKIQIIVVGDFCQLPPVVKNDERKFFPDGSEYAFSTDEWQDCNFVNIILHEIVRQKDAEFSKCLSGLRLGDKSALKYIRENSANDRIEKAVGLTATNRRANAINSENINRLIRQGKPHAEFHSKVDGDFKPADAPALSNLTLAEGARVIALANIHDQYFNGELGTVVSLKNGCVIVEFDNSGTARVEPYTWTSYKYRTHKRNGKSEIVKEPVGTLEQIPLKPSYAITIHKSQGQTYDAVNLQPWAWAPGQLYVALSRCKDVHKLYIDGNLDDEYLISSDFVTEFYAKIKHGSETNMKKVTSVTKSKKDAKTVATASTLVKQSVKKSKSATAKVKKPGRGGSRPGAGRKRKYDSKTVVLRVPEDFAEYIKKYLSVATPEQRKHFEDTVFKDELKKVMLESIKEL